MPRFERLKKSCGCDVLLIARIDAAGKPIYDTNLWVTLEEYTVRDDAREGTDCIVSLKFKEHKEYGVKTYKAAGKTIQKNGYVFKRQSGKDGIVSITAYDQLRYFKNKDTYVYEGLTASEVLEMLCRDFNLRSGTIENTGYKIPSRIEENKSLFEIVQNALDLTLQNSKKMFVLYDDFGKLTLQNISSMGKARLLIDNETAENFDYKSSIDDETYNKIKLTYDNRDTGKREVYIAQNGENINRWGVLQYFGTLNKDENGKAKADSLLSLYNTNSKNLSIKNALGRNGIRAGSIVLVNLKSGNVNVQNHLMTVEKCRHEYRHELHLMDLELTGGGFGA